MVRRQTLIELDDDLLAALDRRAAATGRSRSDLIREAVDLLLAGDDAAVIDEAIAVGYERHPPDRPDAWALAATIAAIKAEPW